MKPNPWDGDWESRIYDGVRALGYASVTEYADASQAASYRELATRLGDDVAIVQLEVLLRDEAKERNSSERFARDSLARLLREYCPEGWGSDDNFTFRAARAFARWVSMLGDGYESAADRTWTVVKRQRPPQGWYPEGPDDPLLKSAFAEAVFGSEAKV